MNPLQPFEHLQSIKGSVFSLLVLVRKVCDCSHSHECVCASHCVLDVDSQDGCHLSSLLLRLDGVWSLGGQEVAGRCQVLVRKDTGQLPWSREGFVEARILCAVDDDMLTIQMLTETSTRPPYPVSIFPTKTEAEKV